MYPWIARNLIYFPVQKLRGETIRKYLREVQDFEQLSPEQMRQVQWQKLKMMLTRAVADSPYYRQLLQSRGIDVRDIHTFDDFRLIPFLTKSIIHDHFDELISRRRYRTSARRTSGSTGIPTPIIKDRQATAYMDAYMYHVYSWHGIGIGTRQARVWGMPFGFVPKALTRAKDIAFNRKRLIAFNITTESAIAYYETILKFRPYFFYGQIHAMTEFCRILIESGRDPAKLGFQVIVTTGELQVSALKQYLEESFRCRVVDEYGCTEAGIIAFECPFGTMHAANHNLLLEVIDPATNSPVAAGEEGEVAITELHGNAMPLIRYRIGDLVRSEPSPCACGRNSQAIAGIVGRTSEMIVTPDGRHVNASILAYCVPKQIKRFRAVQHETEKLEVLLQSASPLSAGAAADFRKKLTSYLGNHITVEIACVDNIPPERSGKLRYFVSDIRNTI
ncbi:MAG: hypothetical protein WBP29_05940 [Candidatus Zixiibacteriota bacterium]